MPPEPYVHIGYLKSFSKLVSKRFAMKLMGVQNIISQASGYRDLNHLYAVHASGDCLEHLQMVDHEVWLHRLGFALGSDLNELLYEEELEAWFRRIHLVEESESTMEAAD